MFRYSLATLLGVVLITAIGRATLIQANEVWRQIVITLTVTTLLFATLAGLFAAYRLRAFGGGFAVVGWVYFALVFIPALGLHDELLTHRAVRSLWAAAHQDEVMLQAVAFIQDGNYVVTSDSSINVLDVTTGKSTLHPSTITTDFEAVGHTLWTLLLACGGGLVAQWLAGRRGTASQQKG